MLQNHRSKLAAWLKMPKDVLAASHFEGNFGQHFISFSDLLWQNILLYRNTFPKMCRLPYKLWTRKKLRQKPRERQICMENGVSVRGYFCPLYTSEEKGKKTSSRKYVPSSETCCVCFSLSLSLSLSRFGGGKYQNGFVEHALVWLWWSPVIQLIWLFVVQILSDCSLK